MIEIIDKKDCCGCSACATVCPVNAITMERDQQGFLYPVIDRERCIQCDKCKKVCPIYNQVEEKAFEQKAFLVQHIDSKVLKDSASGGAFSVIAEAILEKNGVVFGAMYDEDFQVIHDCVHTIQDLAKFRNSKYVQSTIGNSYQKVKKYLQQKRYVCFSGTPCQIEGLLNYLGEDSPFLITVDIVCHAVPSPAVWNTYLDIVKEQNEGIKNLRFRDKDKYGYLYSQFKIENDNGKCVYEGIEKNVMLRAFFSEICNRPSCYECQFKKRYRRSDITLWDCFDLEEFTESKMFNQKAGVSRVLVHTLRGEQILLEAQDRCKLEQITPEKAIHFDAKEMIESVEKNEKYDDFWNDYYANPQQTLKKYFPNNAKSKLEAYARQIMFKLGLYSFIRKMYKKLFGNRRR